VSLFLSVVLFTSLSFFGYGFGCLFAKRMAVEFGRYGLSRLRALIGILEIAGAAGLLVGQALPWIGFLAACGLALLMVAGVAVRVRIRDTIVQTAPAALYAILSLYLAVGYFPLM
jgi:hypothetical protein